MLKRLILMFIVVSLALLLCGCRLLELAPPPGGRPPDPTEEPTVGPCIGPLPLHGHLVSLSFSESHSYRTRVQGYDYLEEDGKHTAYFWLADEDDPYPVPVDEAWVEQLQDIVCAYNVILWDGFNESDPILLDGDSFSISLVFSDGTTVSARGYGSFPEGYGDVSAKIEAHFLQLLPEELRTW